MKAKFTAKLQVFPACFLAGKGSPSSGHFRGEVSQAGRMWALAFEPRPVPGRRTLFGSLQYSEGMRINAAQDTHS